MSFRRVVSALMLAAYLPACASYQSTARPLGELTGSPTPVGRVCVTKRNGVRVEVWEPRVAADSLLGMSEASGADARRVAIALADIQATEVRKFDAGKTVAVVVIIGGTFVLLGAATNSMMDDMWDDASIGY